MASGRMTLWLSNLAAYSVQLAILVGTAAMTVLGMKPGAARLLPPGVGESR